MTAQNHDSKNHATAPGTAPPEAAARVARIALPVPLHRTFDYALNDAEPVVGGRVAVRFAHRPMIGICVELDPDDAYDDPQPLTEVLDAEPLLTAQHMALARWLAGYYHHPLGEVLAVVLPAEARRGAPTQRALEQVLQLKAANQSKVDAALAANDPKELGLARSRKQFELLAVLAGQGPTLQSELRGMGFSTAVQDRLLEAGWAQRVERHPPPSQPSNPDGLSLTGEQQVATSAILAALGTPASATTGGGFQPFLLDGITGSGKTEVYLRALANAVQDDGQALLLVPEIALTPQTVARVRERLPGVVVLHSGLNDKERWDAWLACATGDARVLIGTRSAVFTAFKNLRLIVVDEEHDASFKQQDGLRYSARDFAVMRAREENVPIVLGSATPSLESLHNVDAGRYERLTLTERPGKAELPKLSLLDIRGHDLHEGLSPPLVHLARRHLEQGGQVLVFINRRGFAPTLLCPECGWIDECNDCDVRMTLHINPPHLRCHHCGASRPVPTTCPSCQHPELVPVGQGTQRTEQGLHTLFPNTPVLRIDRDTTRTPAQLDAQLERIRSNEPMILVGTQMLAKGHDFPGVSLVAILGADGGFFSSDFRAPERMAQTILQVAGRAGRAERPGEVVLQTYQPEHPLLQRLVSDGYGPFAAHELAERAAAELPPTQPMAMLRADARDAEMGARFLRDIKARLADVETFGPAPAPVQRISNRFRHQLLVLGGTRARLHQAMTRLRAVTPPRDLRFSIDIDPYDSF